jgi:hypothetical protein
MVKSFFCRWYHVFASWWSHLILIQLPAPNTTLCCESKPAWRVACASVSSATVLCCSFRGSSIPVPIVPTARHVVFSTQDAGRPRPKCRVTSAEPSLPRAEPARLCRLLSSVDCRLLSSQITVQNCSVKSHNHSSVGCRVSTVGCRVSTVECRVSSVECRHSTERRVATGDWRVATVASLATVLRNEGSSTQCRY